MTPAIGLLFVLLAVMAYLFLTEKLPVDSPSRLGNGDGHAEEDGAG